MRRHAPVLSPIKSRYILFLGFGGLLALMVFAGFDASTALALIDASRLDTDVAPAIAVWMMPVPAERLC